MDDFLIGPQSDEKEYSWYECDIDYGLDDYEDQYMDCLLNEDKEFGTFF